MPKNSGSRDEVSSDDDFDLSSFTPVDNPELAKKLRVSLAAQKSSKSRLSSTVTLQAPRVRAVPERSPSPTPGVSGVGGLSGLLSRLWSSGSRDASPSIGFGNDPPPVPRNAKSPARAFAGPPPVARNAKSPARASAAPKTAARATAGPDDFKAEREALNKKIREMERHIAKNDILQAQNDSLKRQIALLEEQNAQLEEDRDSAIGQYSEYSQEVGDFLRALKAEKDIRKIPRVIDGFMDNASLSAQTSFDPDTVDTFLLTPSASRRSSASSFYL